ncbi:cytochrome c maturation protein CcmE [Caldimonas brevitalea]|uniref:Cytochrome c-type biogenesis protein CcmE n=1 Tax=Caldimonas brevitalea TaxID=413882 RepID=A0A0G3BFY4_9BURK|nr:cytochrome c maturation protein CcmE [Caldimonas brevitalea]AKJ28319.1 cytochrome C biogenesis protein CcmE [Caldimonas brevitalea]
MTRGAQRRLLLFLAVVGLLAGGVSLVVFALRDNLVFFYTPSDVKARGLADHPQFRLGGLVERGSVQREPGSLRVRFVVADAQHRLPVVYQGLLPDLFREDKGVVAAGRLGADGVFHAREVLAKHDENYAPPGTGGGAAERPAWVRPQ